MISYFVISHFREKKKNKLLKTMYDRKEKAGVGRAVR